MAIEEKSIHQAATDQYTKVYTATFAATGTRSSVVNLDGRSPIRISMPAGWTGTAAHVRVYLSEDDVTYKPLYDRYNVAYSVTAVASRTYVLPPSDMAGVQYIRLLSATALGTASAQTTACAVNIIARLA